MRMGAGCALSGHSHPAGWLPCLSSRCRAVAEDGQPHRGGAAHAGPGAGLRPAGGVGWGALLKASLDGGVHVGLPADDAIEHMRQGPPGFLGCCPLGRKLNYSFLPYLGLPPPCPQAERNHSVVVAQAAFSSERKRMTTAVLNQAFG